jgi:hypothetical protein
MPGAELAYVDESYDSAVFCMSALVVPAFAWRDAFLRIKTYRKHLKAKYRIFTSKEFHATEFVAGRGRIAVGSQYGAWEDGSSYKNIPNHRLIEDPIFKPSHQSYFLQAADFIAFALLKSEVPPTPHVAKYGLDDTYSRLHAVCAKEAS